MFAGLVMSHHHVCRGGHVTWSDRWMFAGGGHVTWSDRWTFAGVVMSHGLTDGCLQGWSCWVSTSRLGGLSGEVDVEKFCCECRHLLVRRTNPGLITNWSSSTRRCHGREPDKQGSVTDWSHGREPDKQGSVTDWSHGREPDKQGSVTDCFQQAVVWNWRRHQVTEASGLILLIWAPCTFQ